MVRIVLPGLERAKDVAESAKRNIPLLVLILVILLSMTAGVVFFHGLDIKKTPQTAYNYSKEWFDKYDSSTRPPNLLDLLKPEQPKKPPYEWPNATGKVFEVEGDASFFAWRYTVFDVYIENYGWDRSNDTLDNYRARIIRSNVNFTVWKRDIGVSGKKTVKLITLWDPIQGVSIGTVNVKANATVMMSIEVGHSNKEFFITLYSSSEEYVEANFSYIVYGNTLSEDYLASISATLKDAVELAKQNASLAQYILIPPGYLSRHPEVAEYFSSINETIDYSSTTVYEAVSIVANRILADTSIEFWGDMPPGDPVDYFVKNRGGPLQAYVYTVAFMLRLMGLPTRVVLGFAGGFYNITTGLTEITVNDLALWIEVYDPNAGWIPFNVDPFIGNLKNLADILFQITVRIDTYLPGGGKTYLDANFTIYVEVTGPGVSILEGANVSIFDVNITTSPIFNVTLKYDPVYGMLRGNITTSYEVIYNMLGLEPTYGLHIIVARIWGLEDSEVVYLVRRSIIT